MPLEYPDQSYYPSWKVRLTIRLEEFGQGVLKGKVPATPSKNLKGVKQDRAPLDAVPDPEFPGRFLLKPRVTKATLDDAIKNYVIGDSSSDRLTQVVAGIIPKRFDWKQNGFRTADELKLTLRWVDFPIDPRVIRSCAVEFFLGTITPAEFAQGIRGLTRGDVGGGAANAHEPLNLVPDSYMDSNGVRRSNLRFTGWVNKWKMSWNEDEPTVELECQDNTVLLLNQLAPAQLVLGMKDPIDLAIATYLSNFPQFAGLTVQYRGDPNAKVPRLEGALAGTAFRPQLGPQPGQGSGDDLVVWDYLTDVCGSIGHVIRIEGNDVIVQRPSTLLHGDASPRSDDSYKGRKLPSGDYPSRTFVYGRNVTSFEVSRDLQHGETKNVEVRCYSPRRKQVMVARFPGKDARIPTSTPGDARADNKWTIIRVSGVEDQKVLEQIAEDVFHGRNRNEIEVVVKTSNMASFGGGNEDPDLLDCKPGDAVEILVDRANASTTAGAEKNLTSQQLNEEFLRNLGYSKDFAAAYAKAYQDAGFQRLYRVKEMSVTGDTDEGVSFEVRGVNFVQARADKPPAPPQQPPAASATPSQGGGKQTDTKQPIVVQHKSYVNDRGGRVLSSEDTITILKKPQTGKPEGTVGGKIVTSEESITILKKGK